MKNKAFDNLPGRGCPEGLEDAWVARLASIWEGGRTDSDAERDADPECNNQPTPDPTARGPTGLTPNNCNVPADITQIGAWVR